MTAIGRSAGLVTALLLAACSAITPYEVVIPSGVVSVLTAQQVAQKTLDEIAANERKLGYALASARIVRVQFLQPGERYTLRRLDGAAGGEVEMHQPEGQMSWAVEAEGTFLQVDPQTGLIDSKGMHGLMGWDDAVQGGRSYGHFIPCWDLLVPPAAEEAMNWEGRCPP